MKTLFLCLAFCACTCGQAGLGKSTPKCLDKDGDGYGVGPGCLGPDADDTNVAAHTSADVISAYGSINAFLVHLGYQSKAAPSKVWCISPNGHDDKGASSTNADAACQKPFQHWTGVYGHLEQPYIVIFRGGTYSQQINGISGTPSRQNVIMSYPGELATLDYSATTGNAINMGGKSYVTIDGLKILANPSGAGYSSGTYILYGSGSQTITAVNNMLTHCDISGAGTDSNVDADNTINMQVVENVIHDPYPNGGQHNVYLGSNTVATTGAVVSRNILYDVKTGGYPNLQFNGRCLRCYFENNLLYNADGQQMAFLEGVSNSFIRNNLVFNTGISGNPPLSLTIANYDSGQCQKSGLPSICPWDQTGNVIENNTFWAGTIAPFGNNGPLSGPTVEIANNAKTGPCGNGGAPPCGTLGGNIYRNNIIVGPGTVNSAASWGYPPVTYADATPGYWTSDTWVNNIINSMDGSTYIVGFGPSSQYGYHPYNCASLNSMTAGSSGCSTSAPGFVNVNSGLYKSPAAFNFSLAPKSAALKAGTSTDAPDADILGVARSSPPTIGAYEGTAAMAIIVDSLSCTPTTLSSGGTATCTVGVSRLVPDGGTTLSLSSNSPSVTVPPSISVSANSSSAVFRATAGTSSAGETAVIAATLNGSSLKAPLILLAPAAPILLSCPASVASGASATCTVTLGRAAQSGGARVALSTNLTLLTVPASFSIATGSSSGSFSVTGGTTSIDQFGIVTATLSGNSRSAPIIVVPPAGPGLPGWQQLSNTTLSSMCPPNNFGGMTYPFRSMCVNVINAWSGGIGDMKRNRLLVWGGGGPDYSGNEIYSLNIGQNPPTLARLNDPSVLAASGCPETNPDGAPVSRHTYAGLAYIPGADRMFAFSGRIAPCDGGTNHTYTLDLSVTPPVWHAMDPVNGFNPLKMSVSAGGAVCAYDPGSEDVICSLQDTFLRYKYSTNTYTKISTDQHVPFASNAVIDPKRKLMIFMGHEYQQTKPVIKAVSIARVNNFVIHDWTSQVTGCDGLAAADYPGLAYDSMLDRVVGWPNTGSTVYLFNPDMKSCVTQTLGNGPQNPPIPGTGTFGRFQYFPLLDKFAVVPSATMNSFTLTLNAAGGADLPSKIPGGHH